MTPKFSFPNPRKNYLLYFETALILSLAAFISLFNFSFSNKSTNSTMWEIPENEIIKLEAIMATTQEPPKPVAPPEVTVPNLPPEDKIIEEQLQNFNVEFSPEEPLPLPTKNLLTNQKFLVIHEENPRLIGGIEKLQRDINYPRKAIRDKVGGRVIVRFWIDKKGKVHNPRIVKGVRYDLNKEALQAISRAQFLPARKQGKPVAAEQVIFIFFKLD